MAIRKEEAESQYMNRTMARVHSQPEIAVGYSSQTSSKQLLFAKQRSVMSPPGGSKLAVEDMTSPYDQMEVDSQPGSNVGGSDFNTIRQLHKRMKQSSIPLSTGHATTDASTKQPPSDLKSIIDLYSKASNIKKAPSGKQIG